MLKKLIKRLRSQTRKESQAVATQHPHQEEPEPEWCTTETVIWLDTKDTKILITKGPILITLRKVALDIQQVSKAENKVIH